MELNEILAKIDKVKLLQEAIPNKKYKEPIDFETRLHNYLDSDLIYKELDELSIKRENRYKYQMPKINNYLRIRRYVRE